MRYVRDTTGRFPERPHYEPGELDGECEAVIVSFMRERCGQVVYPAPTDVLTRLIERDAEDLDLIHFSDDPDEVVEIVQRHWVSRSGHDHAPRV